MGVIWNGMNCICVDEKEKFGGFDTEKSRELCK